jgi:biopolymer transport protein ExbD
MNEHLLKEEEKIEMKEDAWEGFLKYLSNDTKRMNCLIFIIVILVVLSTFIVTANMYNQQLMDKRLFILVKQIHDLTEENIKLKIHNKIL